MARSKRKIVNSLSKGFPWFFANWDNLTVVDCAIDFVVFMVKQ